MSDHSPACLVLIGDETTGESAPAAMSESGAAGGRVSANNLRFDPSAGSEPVQTALWRTVLSLLFLAIEHPLVYFPNASHSERRARED